MKAVKIVLGIIIAISAISTLAGGMAYLTGPDEDDNLPTHIKQREYNKKAFKISAIILSISILAFLGVSKFSSK